LELGTFIKEKCTLKELGIFGNLKANGFSDTLFLTGYGYIIGKPYEDVDIESNAEIISSYITLSDVIIIRDGVVTTFSDFVFTLYVDQIIATSPIDRDSFLSQMQQVQAV